MEDGVDFFTSGSTGNAKPIHKTWRSLHADAEMLADRFGPLFRCRPLIASTIQAHHMFGRLWIDLLPKKLGIGVLPGPVLSVEELAGLCRRHGKIFFVTTPSFLEKMVGDPDHALFSGAFAGILTSGSLLREPVSESARRCTGVSPIEIFGSTEAGSVAWRQQVNGPSWELLPSVTAECVGEEHRLSVDSPFCLTRPFMMSDAAEILDARHFLLRGRTDRRVKILEEMVSLPDLEEALSAHPYVAKAHALASDETIPRIWALAVLTAEGREALRGGSYHGMIRTLNRSLATAFPPAVLPRRIRFLREMPLNPQGKLPRDRVLPLLRSRLQEPVVEGWREQGGAIEATLCFPPDSIVFQGHFPSFAILPGVAQIYWIQTFFKRCFPDTFAPVRIRRLKFQRMVRPAESLNLQLRRGGAGRFEFLLTASTGEPCCSGYYENGEA